MIPLMKGTTTLILSSNFHVLDANNLYNKGNYNKQSREPIFACYESITTVKSIAISEYCNTTQPIKK